MRDAFVQCCDLFQCFPMLVENFHYKLPAIFPIVQSYFYFPIAHSYSCSDSGRELAPESNYQIPAAWHRMDFHACRREQYSWGAIGCNELQCAALLSNTLLMLTGTFRSHDCFVEIVLLINSNAHRSMCTLNDRANEKVIAVHEEDRLFRLLNRITIAFRPLAAALPPTTGINRHRLWTDRL